MCVLPFLYFFVLFHFRVPNICVKNKQNKKGKLYVDDLLVSVTFVTWEDYSEDFFSLGYWNKHVFLLFIWIHWIGVFLVVRNCTATSSSIIYKWWLIEFCLNLSSHQLATIKSKRLTTFLFNGNLVDFAYIIMSLRLKVIAQIYLLLLRGMRVVILFGARTVKFP